MNFWEFSPLIFIGGSWFIQVWWNCISEKNIWVKQKRKPQLEVQVPLRIHGLFPKSWLVEQVKSKNTGLSTRPYRHVSKIKFRNLKCGQMDQIEYPMEQPDYNNNSRGLFTGSGIYGLKPNPVLTSSDLGSVCITERSMDPWFQDLLQREDF